MTASYNNNELNKGIVLKSLLWKLGERGSVQIIQFLVQILLARLLTPNDYGVLAIILVFISLSNIFIQSGLPTALVQKKEIDSTDISSVLILSIIISFIFIIIIWFSAPIIASFYEDLNITNYLRVLSFILIIGAFNAVQIAIVSRKMEFHKNFYSSLIGILISATVGVILALNNFGTWALIVQYGLNIFCSTIALYFLDPWIPIFKFSLSKTRSLFNYGSKLMIANLISNTFTDIYSLIIGKIYPKKWLGYFETGNRIPSTASNSLTTAVQTVLLPTFSSIQDDTDRIKLVMRKSVKVSAFFIFPIMFILCATASPLVKIFLTEKWILVVPFLQLSCLMYAFYPIHLLNLQAINAIGRSDVFLSCEIKKKITEMIILGITVWFNIYIVAIGRVISSLIALYINLKPNNQFIHYGFDEQIKDLAPAFINATATGLIIYLINYIPISSFLILLLQLISGIAIYLYLSYFLNKETFNYIKSTFLEFKNKRTRKSIDNHI